MAYSVVIAGLAERDLDQALNHIANVLAAPSAAASPLDEFERLLVLLADNPSLFGVDFGVSEAVAVRVRHCMAKGYESFFRVDESNHRVLVLAFLHGPATPRESWLSASKSRWSPSACQLALHASCHDCGSCPPR